MYDNLYITKEFYIEDEVSIEELETEAKIFEDNLEKYKIKALLNGKYDKNNAILTINAGAGGTESCDWVSMLYRMYERWANRRKMQIEVLNSLQGDEAGIKSITLLLKGDYAYGYLEAEKGIHRLVRISPFLIQMQEDIHHLRELMYLLK